MNERTNVEALTLSIAAVERDTGLSKDTLRVWERRYGFPSPSRDPQGERAYPLEQVEKLRLIKRLLDAGHRPGRIVPMPAAELNELTASTVDQPQRRADNTVASADLERALDLLRRHDPAGLRRELGRMLVRHGISRFVVDVVAPLNTAVGDAWLRGQVEVYEEHLYTETVQSLLRQAIASVPEPLDGGTPSVLLSTFPGEPHGLGLLMCETLMAMDGCRCIALGTQTPLWDIVLAAGAYRADIVALSFSGCMSPNQVVDGLAELREKLPAEVGIWVGGSAPVLFRRRLEGVLPIDALDQIAPELRRWRETPR
ncbi:MerR family transcriptional regulator [Rubrivivax gelatinosus]|uniref:Transcriptional regulator, MerR family n=1 Tax=Rubrivivax gelatinosus (strain NBRC 100245 / IL144) TaxID=983917 RepID=I0HXT8_RUBGI|nr:MerR family transcriptional regulator [Rubrivivax gelatinosus]MBG6079757.1 DNA-binding transcriptional MerR regulator [Rubrivivax gelatinosus]BAL97825.1 transcriptional regulator, MerR family [Rubrivivax gelatinosus IL144]